MSFVNNWGKKIWDVLFRQQKTEGSQTNDEKTKIGELKSPVKGKIEGRDTKPTLTGYG